MLSSEEPEEIAQRRGVLLVGRLDVELILKVNLDSLSIGHSNDPDAVSVLGVVLRVVR